MDAYAYDGPRRLCSHSVLFAILFTGKGRDEFLIAPESPPNRQLPLSEIIHLTKVKGRNIVISWIQQLLTYLGFGTRSRGLQLPSNLAFYGSKELPGRNLGKFALLTDGIHRGLP